MAIVNPLLGTVTPWNPPGDPIDMEQIRLDREAEERRKEDERERAALRNNPVDRNVGPRDNSFQVGVHTSHPGYSSFSDYRDTFAVDPTTVMGGDLGADIAMLHGSGTPAEQMARGYADQIGDQMTKAKAKHGFWSGGLLDTITNPLAAVDNYYNHPTNIASTMMTLGGPVMSMLAPAMGAISDYNLTQQAYNRAHAQMGTPGYSYGMLDGQHYSTAPGMFGRGIYGTVPDWFDVDMADTLENYNMGLDADGNPTTDVGSARFSPDGYLSTPFGHDVPTYDDVAALAKAYGTTYDVAHNAINRANAGDGTVDENIGGAPSTAAQTGVAGTDKYSNEIEWDPDTSNDPDVSVANTEADYGDYDADYY